MFAFQSALFPGDSTTVQHFACFMLEGQARGFFSTVRWARVDRIPEFSNRPIQFVPGRKPEVQWYSIFILAQKLHDHRKRDLDFSSATGRLSVNLGIQEVMWAWKSWGRSAVRETPGDKRRFTMPTANKSVLGYGASQACLSQYLIFIHQIIAYVIVLDDPGWWFPWRVPFIDPNPEQGDTTSSVEQVTKPASRKSILLKRADKGHHGTFFAGTVRI